MQAEKAQVAAIAAQARLEKEQKQLASLVNLFRPCFVTDVEFELKIDVALQIEDNSTLPVTVSAIRVLNAPNTRHSFLSRIFDPILSINRDRPYTLSEALHRISVGVNQLHRFDIFQSPIPVSISRPDPSHASTTPTDIEIYLQAREKSRLILKTGTDVGNAEGSAYINVLGRNVFGGAESLNLNVALGTRTRSAYQAAFDTPILSKPDFRYELGGLASSTSKPWSSYEEVLKGAWTKLRWGNAAVGRHEISYNGIWRQLTGLAPNASPTVRNDAGDSVKSSITHAYTLDRRDHPLLPTRGYLSKSTLELAGFGPLQGDVAFGKAELETQTAVPIPMPGVRGKSGIAFTTSLRAGLLYPLPLGLEEEAKPSKIVDRFQLGGPTDVRGFRLSGLGPRDGADAVGGDVYAAGSANLLIPIPNVGLDKPFRLQAFVNGGRLFALPSSSKADETGRAVGKFQQTLADSLQELGNGLPTMAAGVGLVYAHPAARFELNFSLPLTLRKGEEARKGVQFGVGINML